MANLDKEFLNEGIEEERELTKEEIAKQQEDNIIMKLTEDAILPEKTIFVKRLDIPLTLRALTEKEISALQKKYTKVTKVRGRRESKLMEDEFNIALIEKATIVPNFSDARLLNSMNVSSGVEFIRRKFLAGEIALISDEVLELSGFYEELSDDDIKN
ncbi:hypothetical protein QPD51_02830 [Clostridioides difficile]|uniref:phage tail assembly chaperone n=1 Tax=Clostridioides difficile TaxID=1496 RepID=UPI001C1417CF|nr:hypothetical protein [Clostridioides difficile]KAK2237365.1 XkdN [Clostridioides difficile]MCE4768689.1 hypothetical protein [Clostridioides difficile]MCW0785102.1 hypothetical protein [Clostridioides difficile]MDE3446268.1 hypothetical protein [Clostridioides difficile]MDI3127101.1 hypothetical protein [Clostridioides difficile]